MKSHIVRFCIAIPVVALSTTLNGIAISILWGWFIVGKFGLPALSISEAIGLYLVFSYMAYQAPKGKDMDDDPNKAVFVAFITGIARPVLALLVGAIVKSLM